MLQRGKENLRGAFSDERRITQERRPKEGEGEEGKGKSEENSKTVASCRVVIIKSRIEERKWSSDSIQCDSTWLDSSHDVNRHDMT